MKSIIILLTAMLALVSQQLRAEATLTTKFSGQMYYTGATGSDTFSDENRTFTDASGIDYKTYGGAKSQSSAFHSNLMKSDTYMNYGLTYGEAGVWDVNSTFRVRADGEVRIYMGANYITDTWTTEVRGRVNSYKAADQIESNGKVFKANYFYGKAINSSGMYFQLGSSQALDNYFQGFDQVNKLTFRTSSTKQSVMLMDENYLPAFHVGYQKGGTATDIFVGVAREGDLGWNNGSNQTASFSTKGVCNVGDKRTATQNCYNGGNDASDAGGTEQTINYGFRSYGKAVGGSGFNYGFEAAFFDNSVTDTASTDKTADPSSSALMIALGLGYDVKMENSQVFTPFLNLNYINKKYDELNVTDGTTNGKGDGFNNIYTINIGMNYVLPGGLKDMGYLNFSYIGQIFDNQMTTTGLTCGTGAGVTNTCGYKDSLHGVDLIYGKGFTDHLVGYLGAGMSVIENKMDYSTGNKDDFGYKEYSVGMGLSAEF